MPDIIIFKNPDGTCRIISPSPKAFITEYIDVTEIQRVEVDGVETTSELTTPTLSTRLLTIEEIAEKAVPSGLPWRIVSVDMIPVDGTFQDAWVDNANTIDVCMVKARQIHLDNIRIERAKKFIAMGFPIKLDPELEAAIISQETRDKLQALRDIPQNLDLSTAETPEQLKAIWPEELQ